MIPIVSPTHSGNWREPGHALLCLISTHPSSTHPIHPNRSQPFLHSCQILNSTSRVDWFVCTMVFLVPSPPTISSTHPIPPGRSQPFLHSHQILTSHQEWIGLCVPWFCLSHLPLPSHPLTQSTLAGLSHSFACIKSSPCINPCCGWLCPHLHPTPCLLTLPHNPYTMLWLARFMGYAIGGLGAHLM